MQTKDWPENISVLKKPVEMTVMKPTKGKITLIGRRLYTVMLAHSQAEMKLKVFDPEKRYVFRVLLRSLLSHGSFNGGEISFMKTYLREMNTTSIEWESAAQGDGYKWKTLTMVSEAAIELLNGQNWVSWEFPSSIMENIVSPGMYARLDLKIATSISSYVGTALYEICTRYRDNASGVTSNQPPEWWIDALSQAARDPNKRREWRKFKDEKLLAGIQHINEESDLEIELIEQKEGRKVAWVQFAVRKKLMPARQAQAMPVNVEAMDAIEKMAAQLAIPLASVETLIRKYGETMVKEKIQELAKRVEDTSQPVVERKLGYLRFLLENPTESKKIVSKAEAVAKRSEAEEKQAPPPSTPAQPAAQDKGLRARTREQFNEMPEEQRKRFIDAAVLHLKTSNSYNSADMRHSQSTILRPGRFGSVVIEMFGKEFFGAQWPSPSGDALLSI